jgi:hypothetical protein
MTLTYPPAVRGAGDAIAAESRLIIHRPRRRRWRPVAVALAVAVTGGLVAVAVGQLRAPALAFDGGVTVWRTTPGDEAAVDRVDNALGSEVAVAFERSGVFSARVALVNHGRYPVKVQGFPDRGAYTYGLESIDTADDADAPLRPFRPFTLRRGATRWLVLHFRFADCDLDHNAPGGVARTALPVTYGVFGVHHKQAVPFSHFALSVPDGRCDHPVL